LPPLKILNSPKPRQKSPRQLKLKPWPSKPKRQLRSFMLKSIQPERLLSSRLRSIRQRVRPLRSWLMSTRPRCCFQSRLKP